MPEPTDMIMEAIRTWSGVDCPNVAARHGLDDFPALIRELEALRGILAFEDEPSSFEAALLAEQEPAT